MKRTKKIYRASAHCVRAVLVATTIAAFASLWLWTARSGLVDRLDDRLLASYTSYYSSRYERAIAHIKAGDKEKGRDALEALLAKLGTVRKQERLSPAYSAALRTLISLYVKEGSDERAAEMSARLVELDGRDYSYRLIHGRNLARMGRRDEAIEAYRGAFSLAPQSLDAAGSLIDALLGSSLPHEARRAAARYAGANRGGGITLYHANEENPRPTRGATLDAVAFTGRAQSFTLPIGTTGATRLMIALGGLMDTEIELISLAVTTPDGKERIEPHEVSVGTEELRPVGRGRWAAAAGRDPVIYFSLPRRFLGKELVSLELTAALRPYVPDGLAALAGERSDG